MLMQHVMYKDILANRTYVDYPYYDKFDIDNDECLYCYRNHEIPMHEYLDNRCSPEYINDNIIPKIKENYPLEDEDVAKIIKLFSSNNPVLRLTVYAGGKLNRQKFFEDILATNDIKHALIELTGEINAIAMDGLFSLYASALYYLEGKENTKNVAILKECHDRLLSSAYIYMKRGTAMDFFFMPISDIEKATREHELSALMESATRFTEVYIRNNALSNKTV